MLSLLILFSKNKRILSKSAFSLLILGQIICEENSELSMEQLKYFEKTQNNLFCTYDFQ